MCLRGELTCSRPLQTLLLQCLTLQASRAIRPDIAGRHELYGLTLQAITSNTAWHCRPSRAIRPDIAGRHELYSQTLLAVTSYTSYIAGRHELYGLILQAVTSYTAWHCRPSLAIVYVLIGRTWMHVEQSRAVYVQIGRTCMHADPSRSIHAV